MSSAFFESLEPRQLLSAALPQALEPATDGAAAAIILPASAKKVVLPNVVGTYTGTVRISGSNTLTITVTITSQKKGGAIAGIVRSPGDSAVKLSLTGTVQTGRRVTFTFNGRTDTGKTNGTFNGSLSKNLLTISGQVSGRSGGEDFSGTLKVHK